VKKPNRYEKLSLSVQIRRTTEKALLVCDGSKDKEGKDHEVWLPRSQIESEDELKVGEVADITLPRWLVEEKGFII
jgi:hypothetical protein